MTDGDWEVETAVSDEQVEFYREHGYLKFGRIFSKSELSKLREHVDGMIASLPEDKRPEQMDVPHFDNPFLFNYLAHPRVLNVIERFIGPDIVLWSSHLISKRSGDGLAVPWHQDGIYWGKRLEPMRVITMWLAVDESLVTNGCMRVIAGSHKFRDRRYEEVDNHDKNLFHNEVVADDIDPSRIVDLELRIGECHFHDGFYHSRFQPQHLPKASLRLHHALHAGHGSLQRPRAESQPSHLSLERRGPYRRLEHLHAFANRVVRADTI